MSSSQQMLLECTADMVQQSVYDPSQEGVLDLCSSGVVLVSQLSQRLLWVSGGNSVKWFVGNGRLVPADLWDITLTFMLHF